MNKLKIGLFVDAFFPTYDGVVKYVDGIARGLKEKCDITLFCPGMETNEFYADFPYKIIRCKYKKIIGIPYVMPLPKQDKQFLNALRESKFDLVHIHSPFAVGKLGYQYAQKNNIPVVTTFHSQFKKDFYHHTKSLILTKILLKNIIHWVDKSDEIWTNNNAMVNLLTKKYHSKAKKRVVGNFTVHETVKYCEKEMFRAEFNKLYDITNETKLLLFAGRLIKAKNVFFLIKVANILKNVDVHFRLIFVGDGVDEKKIKNKVKKYKLENYVLFLGKISEIAQMEKIYAIADLLVFPSKYDATSLVQLEAAMQFLPTLFLEKAITASAIKKNWTGFLSEKKPSEYALRIVSILGSSSLYKHVREHCRTIAKSWEQSKNEIYDGYTRIIRQHNKNR